MSMKYFEYILFLLPVVFFLLPLVIWRINNKLHFLQKLAILNILKRQQHFTSKVLFSTPIILESCRHLYFKFDKKSTQALQYLIVGKPEKAIAVLHETNILLSILLLAHINAKLAYGKLKKHKKQIINHPKYRVYYPILAHLLFDFTSFHNSVQSISGKGHSSLSYAYYNYISTYVYLTEGDMLSASQNASAALKYFEKHRYFAESAECYILLAEIYRISCINDIAHTMLDSALKIYKKQNLSFFIARTLTYKGMLMLFENQYDAAQEYYIKAISLTDNYQLISDINNQQAILYLSQNRLTQAMQQAKSALKIHTLLKNKHTEALSRQLLSQITMAKKQYPTAEKYALSAADLYLKQKNYSAYFECLYIASQALYKHSKYQKSEQYLRHIIELSNKYKSNFHIANAYSLLGLIYLYLDDLQRAKVLFQQSLFLEQKNQRSEGLIVDYNNLALIASITGDEDTAKSNLNLALEYAQKVEDTELISIIRKKYNNLT